MEPDNQIPQPDISKPQPGTDFGEEQFDSTPIKAGRFSNFNERIFSLMTPKRKAIQQEPINPFIRDTPRLPQDPRYAPVEVMAPPSPDIEILIPPTHEVQNGLLFPKKSLAEKVRDQIRYPVIKSTATITSGLALVIFAVGAYLLYSALPTRPDLVLGIILVSLAGNILMNNR
jgi:hypothetical protein